MAGSAAGPPAAATAAASAATGTDGGAGAPAAGAEATAGAPAPKKVRLMEFSAASRFYGARQGYVFTTGAKGLGYYLDDVALAKRRVVDGLAGPGLFARAPDVDVEAPAGVADAAPAAPAPRVAAAAELPVKPRAAPAFDPYADLPATKATAPARPRAAAPAPAPEPRGPVRVFTPGLFQLERVHCLHIVRKHRDARNPTSWRHPSKKIERSRDDATGELELMRKKLLAAPSHRRRSVFMELAKKFSECSSAKKGGDLGVFRRGKMSAAFEQAAFNLDVHELSKTVASSSGVHLILRVA